MPDPEMLTVQESTQITGYSEARSRQLIKAGVLPACRVGKRSIRIPRRALEKWLEEQAALALSGCLREDPETRTK